MKFTISKKTIEKHLDNVSRALVSNNPFPALTGILILANESNIQFVVSNGNLSIKEIVEFDANTKVELAGKVLVPGKIFKDVIKKQGDLIEISTDDNLMSVTSRGSKVQINLLDVHEYPTISFEAEGKELLIDSESLNNLIKNVSFAAAENDKRIILNGVNLVASNGKLKASATNSYRLAQSVVDTESNVEFNITILSKNLKDFYPANAKGQLKINVDDSKIITRYENSIIVSKLIDGVYPEVDKLIPNNFEVELTIDSREIVDLIERATVISEETQKVVKLTIENKILTLESRRKEIGDSSVTTSDFIFTGENYGIAFNGQFLKEAVSKFSGKVVIGFTGVYKPFIVKSESNKNTVQMVLPHRSF